MPPRSGRLPVRTLLTGILVLWLPAGVAGQSGDPLAAVREPATPGWMTAWSPLATLGDRQRTLPLPPAPLRLLDAPAPRVGQLWSAGNPAALAHEVGDAWGELRFGGGGEEGDYRRPLDADEFRVLQVSGLRWQPLGERSAVAGRVVADETISDVGSLSPLVVRHSPDPFVVVDTTTPPMRHVRLVVEGAYGWRSGPWGVGLGLGLEISDDRTRKARGPRLGRTSVPAVSAGVLRMLRPAGLSVSVYGRWSGANENSRIALPGGVISEIRALDGLGDPEPRQVAGPSVFTENVGRDVYALGAALAGRVRGWRWAARLEREDLDNEHERRRLIDEPPNRWEADGWRFGADVAGDLGPARATASVLYTTLDGEAFRRDLVGQGAIYRSEENAFRGFLDVRAAGADSVWSVGARISVERDSRVRRDFLVSVTSDVESWLPGVGVEVARRFSEATAVSLGGGFAAYEPTATLPDPDALGPIHRELIAPELALYATEARAYSVSLTLRTTLDSGLTLLARGLFNRIEPTGGAEGSSLGSGFAPNPDSERHRLTVEVGAIWSVR